MNLTRYALGQHATAFLLAASGLLMGLGLLFQHLARAASAVAR